MKRTAFVTGAGQGIGLAIAKRMVEAGYNVVIADINLENAQKAAEELGSSVAVKLDVTKVASIEEALKEGAEAFGGIDLPVDEDDTL